MVIDTVDRRTPARPGVYENRVNNGINCQPQLSLPDLFHQQYDFLVSCSSRPFIHVSHGTVVVWMARISTWNAPPLLRLRGAPSGHGRTSKRWVMCCSVWHWGMVTEDVCSPYLENLGGSNICFTPIQRRNKMTSFMVGLTKQLVYDLPIGCA